MTDSTSTAPLQASLLPSIDSGVVVPEYDRSKLRPSIVHIGVGGFHRAHLATYIDELCRLGHTDWSIVGTGVLSYDAAMADALGAQDHLYTLVTRGATSTQVQVIGSIVDYLLATPDAQPMIDRIAAEDTQIVSMTVTEGGYPVDDLTGKYAPESSNAGPTSAFGIVAAALEQRRLAHGKPITVMSCDNVMHNGQVAQAAVLGEAARFGSELLSWIETSVSFPNSMVDRITPATADSDREWLEETHHISDRWPVVTEPFRQWVVEDNFAGDRLPFEELDIIVTDDVEPYEIMKLRLLNAGHSCLSYLSALHGIDTVDAAMANEKITRYVRAFLDFESKPALPPVAGIDIDSYNDTLIERFSNPNIGDQISRLALDGSAKFPKFLLPTLRAQVASGGPIGLATLAMAAWCQYLNGVDDHGNTFEVASDPNLDQARHFAELSIAEPTAFLGFDKVFDAELAGSERFRSTFAAALNQLRDGGALAAIDTALNELESR